MKPHDKPRLSTDAYIGRQRSVFAEKKTVKGFYALHWHDYFEVELILGGRGTQILNGRRCTLERGAVYFLTPTDFHEIYVDEPLTLYNISFDLSSVPPFLLEQAIKKEGCVFYPSPSEFSRLAHLSFLLADAFSAVPLSENGYIDNLLNCLIIRLTDMLSVQKDKSALTSSSVQNILLYMHLHFREQLTLNSLAAFAHLSPNYFSELFHSETGCTVMQYLASLRINYAKKLLDSTDLSVTDVCFACGYSSLSNFMKSFKKLTSLSPLNYRKLRTERNS